MSITLDKVMKRTRADRVHSESPATFCALSQKLFRFFGARSNLPIGEVFEVCSLALFCNLSKRSEMEASRRAHRESLIPDKL